MLNMFTENQEKAFRLLAQIKDVYCLAGDRNKELRQSIYGMLKRRKTTKAESGINNIQQELFNLSGVTGNCLAVKNQNLLAWLKTF